ncbi:MAG: Rossmann-like domain-containing protein [Bacillota bacterium]
MGVLKKTKNEFFEIIKDYSIEKDKIDIEIMGLSPEEAIGNPGRDDFPLLIGKEVMIQADYSGSLGQAFTDHPGRFSGSIADIIDLKLDNNYHRALFISTVNAVLNHLNMAEKTIHCRDQEPHECSQEMVNWIRQNSDAEHIGIIGYQPAITEECSKVFGNENVKVTDLNPKLISEYKDGVKIWDGNTDTEKLIKESDLVLVTGSSVVNNSIDNIIDILNKYSKEYYFFGNTIAGAAVLADLPRLCFCAH